MPEPLAPEELYPAGVAGVTARFIELATGVRIRVAERGAHDAPPVVLLHGWSASLYLFRHALELLPRRGLRAIAVDLRGHGLSDKPLARGAYSLDAQLADLGALLDALSLPRATLVGQSMGGGIALHYALRFPGRVAGVALVNPACLVPIPLVAAGRIAPRALVRALDRRLMPRWLVGLILRHLAHSDPAFVTERDVDEYWGPTQLRGFVAAARTELSEFDWRPITPAQAAALAVPSVVILGDADRLVRKAEGAARRLARSSVYTMPGGHCVNAERPDAVYGLIADFCLRAQGTQQTPQMAPES